MRKTIGALLVSVMLVAGGCAARAQIVDPTTGIPVDASTDPMDFAAIMTGQPTNVGMEANMEAISQMNAMQASMQATAQASTDAMNASLQQSDNTPAVRVVPKTPKPTITPNGGTFKGSVQVAISDSDAKAVVFYTTDGTKPTTSSARYTGPITVSAKEKVQALAFDLNELPSDVVSKTFKMKAT